VGSSDLIFSRESFLVSHPCNLEEVPTPAGIAYVRAMTAGERDRFDLAHATDPGLDFRARMLVHTVCDEAGNLIFKKEDIPQLTALPAHLVDPLLEASIRVNQMSAEDLEALRKNSEGRSDDSSSGSASRLDGRRESSKRSSQALS
jgi:hypothetical protein